MKANTCMTYKRYHQVTLSEFHLPHTHTHKYTHTHMHTHTHTHTVHTHTHFKLQPRPLLLPFKTGHLTTPFETPSGHSHLTNTSSSTTKGLFPIQPTTSALDMYACSYPAYWNVPVIKSKFHCKEWVQLHIQAQTKKCGFKVHWQGMIWEIGKAKEYCKGQSVHPHY